MKLRNKKTGEIGHLRSINWNETALIIMDKDGVQLAKYSSLAELNAEWEDAPEEPKGIKDIYFAGATVYIEMYNQEEAIKVEEKLKAWKRLKDKGFRFNGWNGTQIGSNIAYISEIYYEGCADDMDLLFGGEE